MKEHIKFYHKGDVRVTEFSETRLEDVFGSGKKKETDAA